MFCLAHFTSNLPQQTLLDSQGSPSYHNSDNNDNYKVVICLIFYWHLIVWLFFEIITSHKEMRSSLKQKQNPDEKWLDVTLNWRKQHIVQRENNFLNHWEIFCWFKNVLINALKAIWSLSHESPNFPRTEAWN